MPTSDIMTLLSFDEDDIHANRQGVLSENQRTRLGVNIQNIIKRRSIIWRLVLFVNSLILVIEFLIQHKITASTFALITVISGFAWMFWFLLSIFLKNAKAALENGIVESTQDLLLFASDVNTKVLATTIIYLLVKSLFTSHAKSTNCLKIVKFIPSTICQNQIQYCR